MSNPLFQALGGVKQIPQMPGQLGNFQQLMQQFRQFQANFQGDPKRQIEQMLQSGQISQQQLDQVQALARQFMPFLN